MVIRKTLTESASAETKRQKHREAISEVMDRILLPENAIEKPQKHKQVLIDMLEHAKEIELASLWEALVGSTRQTCVSDSDWNETSNLLQRARHKHAYGLPLTEAETMAADFQLLTQAKLFTTMMATYQLVPAIYESIFGTFNSPYKTFDHQIPSEVPGMQFVAEADEYPEAGLTDRYAETKALKHGRRISLTRETMIADKTGQVVEQAENLAQQAKFREDDLAALAFADSSNGTYVTEPSEADAGCYFPEGTRVALFRTSAGSTKVNYETSINKVAGNNLLHWDSLQAAIELLLLMETPTTAQKIDVIQGGTLKLVVPLKLAQRASLLSAPGALMDIARNASAGTESPMLRVPDWIRNMGIAGVQTIVWPKLVSAATAIQSTWYLGGRTDLQFRKHQRWAAEFTRAGAAELGNVGFTKDIIAQVKAGFNAGFRAVDDKYCIQNTNA